ncbi:hypothetical protein RO1_25610 [Roseburia intestinalis XB6B4]|uniref:Uncharacterized protein n=1 Tax=Roseburia intestinalis XB6B4 TaxID=718255 RepID=D4L079_9FIRM|nr:hypothetical protein RO1_25610 [Roseburia intestinalis XB6B4]
MGVKMSSWTLYFIYYKSFNTNINRFAGVFVSPDGSMERKACLL